MSPVILPSEVPSGALLVDARSGPAGAAAYAESHLAGAIHVDLETHLSGDTSNPTLGGRHPLPALAAWAETLGRLGIDEDTDIVAYDDKGGANAASRLWWMLRAVGHRRVRVMSGGWQAAIESGLDTDDDPVTPAPTGPYPVSEDWLLPVVHADLVAARADDPKWTLLDVREAPRYRGEIEPLDPVAGHIPGALNLHFGQNLGADGHFLAAETLAEKYRALLGHVPPMQLIVSCGSGVTACHTLLALEAAGLEGAQLYVGSWSEWCRSSRPRAKGAE